MDCMCSSARRLHSSRLCLNAEYSHSHLAVLGYDAHSEIQSHVDQEECVWKHVKPFPCQAAGSVHEGYLHGNANQVEERDGHHAHDVVTPAGKDHTQKHMPQIS